MMKLLQKRLLLLSARVPAALAVAFCLFFAASAVNAEQIAVKDSSGNTRSMMELPAGSSAKVIVGLRGSSESTPLGVMVSLLAEESTTESKNVSADERGVAEFSAVSAGSYAVSVLDKEVRVADVRIVRSTAKSGSSAKLSDDQTRERGRAMYVAGASAVAGVAGVAAVLGSDSSSGGGSGERGSLGFINSDGAVTGGSAESGMVVSAQEGASNFTGVNPAPDSGDPSPAPTTGSVNTTPSTVPTPETPEAPPADQIAPPPDLTDPMTPS